jgi:hypothetical protein
MRRAQAVLAAPQNRTDTSPSRLDPPYSGLALMIHLMVSTLQSDAIICHINLEKRAY